MKHIAKLTEVLREWWKSGQILSDTDNPIIFDHPMVKEYMDRIYFEKKEADARVEKIVATAVIKLSMSKMGMSKEEALQAARAAVAFLRDVRAKKLLEEGKITEEGYQLYNRLIHSAWVKAAVKTAIKHTGKKVKVILEELVEKTPLKALKPVFIVLNSLIPEEVKQKAKEKAKELLIKAVEEFPRVVAPMIEKGYKVAKKVVETIDNAIDNAVERGRAFVESRPVLKDVLTKAKAWGEKVIGKRIQARLKQFA